MDHPDPRKLKVASGLGVRAVTPNHAPRCACLWGAVLKEDQRKVLIGLVRGKLKWQAGHRHDARMVHIFQNRGSCL